MLRFDVDFFFLVFDERLPCFFFRYDIDGNLPWLSIFDRKYRNYNFKWSVFSIGMVVDP